MNIAVLLGGISPERNVSIAGGKAITNALTERGHSVILIDPSRGSNAVVTAEMLTQDGYRQLTPRDKLFDKYSVTEFCCKMNSMLKMF